MDRGPCCSCLGRDPLMVSPSSGTLPRLFCVPMDQHRLAQPPEPAMKHHKRFRTGFHPGLTLSLQGAEMTPHQAPSQGHQMSLLSLLSLKPPGSPSDSGNSMAEGRWDKGGEQPSLNPSHVSLCFPSVPAGAKGTLAGIAHGLAEHS